MPRFFIDFIFFNRIHRKLRKQLQKNVQLNEFHFKWKAPFFVVSIFFDIHRRGTHYHEFVSVFWPSNIVQAREMQLNSE